MVTKLDVFYVVASRGVVKISAILDALSKSKDHYNSIHNHVVQLEKENLLTNERVVKIKNTTKTQQLFNLISFCVHNKMNYNLLLKHEMVDFICCAMKKEFITIGDTSLNSRTFAFYIEALFRYGLLLRISKKPLKVKLLRHHFFLDLQKYLGNKAEFYKSKHQNLISEIKKELTKYKKIKRIRIVEEEIQFIHFSLLLEGNPLTLPETEVLIRKHIAPKHGTLISIQEVTNYKRAVDLMITNAKKKESLNMNLILHYQELAMHHIGEAGKLREKNVIIKNNPKFKTAKWQDIPKKLCMLMEAYSLFIQKKNAFEKIIEFAAFFHNEFQRIHPFIDGNSRIARLLTLHILRSEDIPLLELPMGYFDLYLDLTKRSKKRDDEALSYLLQEIILFDLKKING